MVSNIYDGVSLFGFKWRHEPWASMRVTWSFMLIEYLITNMIYYTYFYIGFPIIAFSVVVVKQIEFHYNTVGWNSRKRYI